MKKGMIVLIFACCFFNAFCQTAKENFLNAVHKSIFTSSSKTNYLNPKTYSPPHIDSLIEAMLIRIVPIEIAKELCNSIKEDTATENWTCQNLKRVTCVSRDSFLSARSLAPLYNVSKPVFSKDGNWCIVSVRVSEAMYGFEWGKLMLFQIAKGKWKPHIVSRWTS